MSEEVELLKEISRKLSQIIILWKISNSKAIEDMKNKIRKDKASKLILDLANGSMATTQLKKKVAADAKVSLRTVEGRIRSLLDAGALVPKRKGRFTCYENSGLFD